MHSLVRRYLKTGVFFLGVGLVLGLWMMAERELGHHYVSPYAMSAHTHAILVGFVMMMILGVALWLFPRPTKDDPRYTPAAAHAAYWLVTAGTGARIVAELTRQISDALWLRALVFTTGALQVAGLGLFFYTMWSRIRPAGSQAREAAGERF